MKIFQLIFVFLILNSCSVISSIERFNTPFVNSTETTKLDFDMTKEDVLEILGEPLIVKRGTGSTRTIIWLYEVRTITVEGEITGTEKLYNPKKYDKNQRHNKPNHRLELEFIDGKLINWYPEGENPNNQKQNRY